MHSECSKVRYYEPKINKFKDNKSTTANLCTIIVSNINLDLHVSTKVNIVTFYNGVWGIPPQNPKFFLKKIKENGGFSLK